MSLLQILPLDTLVAVEVAAGPLHQVVLHTAALGLVWCDQHVGRDEECSVLSWRHHVVCLVPNSEVLADHHKYFQAFLKSPERRNEMFITSSDYNYTPCLRVSLL